MLEKIFQKILKNPLHNRDLETSEINKNLHTVVHDSMGNLTYLLQGTYTYEQVQKLNELTTYSAIYGYCPQKGPIAIIGIINIQPNWNYFEEVSAYGEPHSNKEFEFQNYSKEETTHISNYTVYGIAGIHEIADFVKFDKINYIYDIRYKDVKSHEYRVLKMKCKLEGLYTFKEAKKLANTQQCWKVNQDIAFATLENGEHVAIMSFSYDRRNEVAGFRDVWENGANKPPTQKIIFMTDEEAVKINNFCIYLYDCCFLYNYKKTPHVVKFDRTFASGFDFYNTPDGKDMRLCNL